MAESVDALRFGPGHSVTRLARVRQQLRVFADLHTAELDGVVSELEAAGAAEPAARLKAYRDLHAQEAGLVLEELEDLCAELEAEAHGAGGVDAPMAQARAEEAAKMAADPGASSPRRARWLAERARRHEPEAISRRAFLTRS